ncbi:hypothetical protein CLV98_10882 [Dyadobacter jejuensis]|uniref:Uncharacterized protein n=1 Tax=Dyadobacter jejuensis TaxID=1082580 RepID=A0A316AHL8_9BACT|nr:hypothetical protein [Dyadobacter jejuensis]PWJ57162.1 hypothetical protein CLV98_10882 [Dyadobacter jejuensis]
MTDSILSYVNVLEADKGLLHWLKYVFYRAIEDFRASLYLTDDAEGGSGKSEFVT